MDGTTRARGQSVQQEKFSARLKRFNVQDSETGLTLFEHVWAWRGNRSTDGLDALVATFYQFASSIDKAHVHKPGVSRVLFELPQAKRQPRGRQTARTNQSRLRAGLTMAPAEIMEMICGVNEKIRVVMFHDVTRGGEIDKVDSMVLELLQTFTKRYGDALDGDGELRGLLTEVYQSNPSDERNVKYTSIHDRFRSFEEEIKAVVGRIGRRPSVRSVERSQSRNTFLEGGGLTRVGSSTGNMLNKILQEERGASVGGKGDGGGGGGGGGGVGGGSEASAKSVSVELLRLRRMADSSSGDGGSGGSSGGGAGGGDSTSGSGRGGKSKGSSSGGGSSQGSKGHTSPKEGRDGAFFHTSPGGPNSRSAETSNTPGRISL
jgi:hypothetical protein